jgi:hypothetical protein
MAFSAICSLPRFQTTKTHLGPRRVWDAGSAAEKIIVGAGDRQLQLFESLAVENRPDFAAN